MAITAQMMVDFFVVGDTLELCCECDLLFDITVACPCSADCFTVRASFSLNQKITQYFMKNKGVNSDFNQVGLREIRAKEAD
jgi:hypothetical protein